MQFISDSWFSHVLRIHYSLITMNNNGVFWYFLKYFFVFSFSPYIYLSFLTVPNIKLIPVALKHHLKLQYRLKLLNKRRCKEKKAQCEFERTAVSMRCIILMLRWTNPRWPELGRHSKLLHCRISLIFCVCVQTEAARYEPADLMTKHDHFLAVRSINRHCYKKSSSSSHHCHWRTGVYLFI